MRIFITGASGCIGHYIVESLIQETDHELFLLVRNPDRLKFDYKSRPGIHILQGDMQGIEQFNDLLKTINTAILIATSWGGVTESFEINVVKTIALIKMLDMSVCQQVIYFSTASILDRKNRLLKEAGEIGTTYVSTKYGCYSQFSQLEIAAKITTIFPTLVFGGEENKPYSHLSGGLPDVLKLIDLIRWFKADGSFHFIHAKDIAQVVVYLVENPPSDASQSQRQFVLGNPYITVDCAIEEICVYLGKRIYFRIPLSITLANFFIAVFRLQMEEWDRFSMNYRHFIHEKVLTPADFGLTNYCSTVEDIFRLRGIPRKKIRKE